MSDVCLYTKCSSVHSEIRKGPKMLFDNESFTNSFKCNGTSDAKWNQKVAQEVSHHVFLWKGIIKKKKKILFKRSPGNAQKHYFAGNAQCYIPAWMGRLQCKNLDYKLLSIFLDNRTYAVLLSVEKMLTTVQVYVWRKCTVNSLNISLKVGCHV